MGSGDLSRADPPRRVLPVSTLVPGSEDAGGIEQTPNADGSNAEEPGLACGAAGKLGPCDAVPLVAPTDPHHSMDATDASPSGRCLATAARVDPEHSVGLGSHESQNSQSAAVETCPTTAAPSATESLQAERSGEEQEAREGSEVSRSDLLDAMMLLSLDNSGDMCYANSSFLCVVWSLLTPGDFNCADWGRHSAAFCDLLCHGGSHLPRLDDASWFQSLVSEWEDRSGQADSAEFTSLLLRGMGSNRISNVWHRRLHQNDRTIIHDMGDVFQPLTLQIDPSGLIHNQVHLNDLLRCWHSELGMCGALLTASDHVCIHLDRLYQTTGGRLQKHTASVFFEDTIQVPVFSDGRFAGGVEGLFGQLRIFAFRGRQRGSLSGSFETL